MIGALKKYMKVVFGLDAAAGLGIKLILAKSDANQRMFQPVLCFDTDNTDDQNPRKPPTSLKMTKIVCQQIHFVGKILISSLLIFSPKTKAFR